VALRRDRPAGDYRAALERVQGQAARLRQVVEMLLFLARADADARPAELEAVDLAAWLPTHLETWSGHERQPDLRLVVASGSPAWVRVHGPLLGQLLDNLLENACKYSRPGTSIVVHLDSEGGWVTLVVEDSGDGIAAEDLPHVFEPFYRAPQARRNGLAGVGLGLAVCRRIAAALGGTVEAESTPGRGSRFVLRLPEVGEGGELSR
jgi:signal transduction histidine kinase